MAGCKRCSLKWGKGEGKKKRKEKIKGGKMGFKLLFFFIIIFFISPRAGFFHMRSGHFSNI